VVSHPGSYQSISPGSPHHVTHNTTGMHCTYITRQWKHKQINLTHTESI